MKIVVVTESAATGGQMPVLVLEKDLFAFQVLVARAGQKVKAIKDAKEVIHAV